MKRPVGWYGLITLLGVSLSVPSSGVEGATYYCEGYKATVVGTARRDYLVGGQYRDVFVGLAGDDDILAGPGDIVCGNEGHDTISIVAQKGEKGGIVYGGKGNDTIYGSNARDTLSGNTGNDTINGVAGGDTIYGNEDNDILTGSCGWGSACTPESDYIYGGQGNDRISGGSGNDRLEGNLGDDYISGGSNDITRGNDWDICSTGEEHIGCELIQ